MIKWPTVFKDSIVNIVFRGSLGDEVHAMAKPNVFSGLGTIQTEAECYDNPDEDIEVSVQAETRSGTDYR